MNTKYKINQVVFFVQSSQICGRPITEIRIYSNTVKYYCGGNWMGEDDIFVDIGAHWRPVDRRFDRQNKHKHEDYPIISFLFLFGGRN